MADLSTTASAGQVRLLNIVRAGGSPPLNKSYCGSTLQRLQRRAQSSHAFTQFLFVGAERDAQKPLAFITKRSRGNGDHSLLESGLGDFQFVAVGAHINHRVERTVRRNTSQS